MAITQQFVSTAHGAATTTATATFSAPPAGTGMAVFLGVRGNRESSLGVTSGWAIRQVAGGSQLTGAVATKISDGTETSVSFTWTSNTQFRIAAAGYSTDTGSITFDNSAENDANIGTDVTAQLSGTVNAAAAGFAIAGFASQTSDLTTPGAAVTNSYSIIANDNTNGANRPMAALAFLELGAGGNTDTEYSTTDATGADMYGCLVTFTVSGGGGPSIPPLGWHHLQGMHAA